MLVGLGETGQTVLTVVGMCNGFSSEVHYLALTCAITMVYNTQDWRKLIPYLHVTVMCAGGAFIASWKTAPTRILQEMV